MILQVNDMQIVSNFFSYALFPLLLLFDAAVNIRSSRTFDSEDGSLGFTASDTVPRVSDFVAESIVLCLEEVLKKCQLGSVNQVPELSCVWKMHIPVASERLKYNWAEVFLSLYFSRVWTIRITILTFLFSLGFRR